MQVLKGSFVALVTPMLESVVNENIISDPVGSMLANQYGHTINDIDEHVVLEKDRGNAVANLEL